MAGRGSGGAAVEEPLGEFAQLHAWVLAVGQDRIDPRPRATYRSDPVHGVLAAENRERTRTGGQLEDAVRSAVQGPLDAREILVVLVAQPGLVVEVDARLGLLVHP